MTTTIQSDEHGYYIVSDRWTYRPVPSTRSGSGCSWYGKWYKPAERTICVSESIYDESLLKVTTIGGGGDKWSPWYMLVTWYPGKSYESRELWSRHITPGGKMIGAGWSPWAKRTTEDVLEDKFSEEYQKVLDNLKTPKHLQSKVSDGNENPLNLRRTAKLLHQWFGDKSHS